MQKWEYTTYLMKLKDLGAQTARDKKLTDLGNEGWELVFINTLPIGDPSTGTSYEALSYTFKRPKQEGGLPLQFMQEGASSPSQ